MLSIDNNVEIVREKYEVTSALHSLDPVNFSRCRYHGNIPRTYYSNRHVDILNIASLSLKFRLHQFVKKANIVNKAYSRNSLMIA